MISILRKIRKSLILSGSTRKYIFYALGEIALVVIGILIALQINNWNNDRLDRNKERLLLKEINNEFKINKEELEGTVWAYNHIRSHCTSVINLFPINPQELNLDSFALSLLRMRGLPSADLSMGSIKSIINSSSFEIISNKELRSLLIQWEDLISDYFERESQAINYARQTIIPYLGERIPQPYRTGLEDKRVDLSFLNTIDFENLIYDRLKDINVLLNIVEQEEDDIRKSLDRIIILSNTNND